jgi:cell division protein FtsQ
MAKVKKIRTRKFNFIKFILFVFFITVVFLGGKKLIKERIHSIIILNNYYLDESTIIEKAKIENYPSFILTSPYKIKNNIKKLDLVKDVKVKKKFWFSIEIDITENKVLYLTRSDGMYTLSNHKKIEGNFYNVPILINYVPSDIESKFIDGLSNIDNDIINKISEIEYSSTNYDNERFLLYMNDENCVYITLSKLNNLNKYNEIKKKLEGHKGILYLDSGNYLEILE